MIPLRRVVPRPRMSCSSLLQLLSKKAVNTFLRQSVQTWAITWTALLSPTPNYSAGHGMLLKLCIIWLFVRVIFFPTFALSSQLVAKTSKTDFFLKILSGWKAVEHITQTQPTNEVLGFHCRISQHTHSGLSLIVVCSYLPLIRSVNVIFCFYHLKQLQCLPVMANVMMCCSVGAFYETTEMIGLIIALLCLLWNRIARP